MPRYADDLRTRFELSLGAGPVADARYARLAALAAEQLGAPMAAVVAVGRSTVFTIGTWGLPGMAMGAAQCPAALTSGGQAVTIADVLVDERTRSASPPHPFRAYLGWPIGPSPNEPLGALCVMDPALRHFTDDEVQRLGRLALLASDMLAADLRALGDDEARRRHSMVMRGLASAVESHEPADELITRALDLLAETFPGLRVVWVDLSRQRIRSRERGGQGLAALPPLADGQTTDAYILAHPRDFSEALKAHGLAMTEDLLAAPADAAVARAFVESTGIHATLDVLVQAEGRPVVLSFHADRARRWRAEEAEALQEMGRVAAVLLARQDAVESRRLMEDELRHTNGRLSALLASQQAGTLVEDERRRVFFVNRPFLSMWGVTAAERDLLGVDAARLWAHLAGRTVEPGFLERMAELIARGESARGLELRMADGRVLELDSDSVTAGDERLGRTWQFRDVTARAHDRALLEKAREEAERIARAKSDFLATVSHELRTPMNGVLGMLSLLADAPLPGEQKAMAQTALQSGETLLGLLNDILDVARLEAGQLPLNRHPFEPAVTALGVVKLFTPIAQQRGLALTLEVAPEVPTRVVGDETKVRQVLTNLISNALKFTPAGEVSVRLTPAAGAVMFAVEDSGPGLPPTVREHLFERFTRGSSAASGRQGGLGLGLWICRQLVELMGGAISLEPTASGACFVVRVPLPEAAPAVNVEERPPSFAGVKALVVDDNAVNRTVARGLLASLGCEVVLASGGPEALALARAQRFDVVFMDCYMPDMDGFEATQQLRRLDPDVPIIGLSASALAQDIERGKAMGMNDWLTKPTRRLDFARALSLWTSAARGPVSATG